MPSQASGQIPTTLGRNIRRCRDAAALTQRQLAAVLDVDPMLLSKWERGKHRPSDDNLVALADHFHRDLAWFYTDHSDERMAA